MTWRSFPVNPLLPPASHVYSIQKEQGDPFEARTRWCPNPSMPLLFPATSSFNFTSPGLACMVLLDIDSEIIHAKVTLIFLLLILLLLLFIHLCSRIVHLAIKSDPLRESKPNLQYLLWLILKVLHWLLLKPSDLYHILIFHAAPTLLHQFQKGRIIPLCTTLLWESLYSFQHPLF